MITANVYNRVFFIKGEQYGTAFVIDVDAKQYLVTARHLLSDPTETKNILYFHDNKWKTLDVKVVGVGRGELDIAVLSPSIRMSPAMPMEPTSTDITLGQDVYFVGYPFKMWADLGAVLNGRPAPFIKKGTLSSAFHAGDPVQRMFVDAINNEGFSGGPLLFQPNGSKEFRVAGIVAKFKTEEEPVLDEFGEKTKMKITYNTGFLIAYDIKHAIDLIHANPVGLPLVG